MRILLLTQWFEPEPVAKGLAFAREMIAQGHEVHVITGFPNYPTGELYPGYHIRPFRHEILDGVSVLRVALYPSHDRSAVHRILTYASFAASSAIAGILTRFRADVIYVYHPPLSVGMAGAIIGWVRRTPFVYDIQDLWPDTLSATGMIGNPRLLARIGALAKRVYARASMIIAQSPGFHDALAERGVPAHKLRMIYNWSNETQCEASPVVSVPGDESAPFTIVFAGNMGPAQGLEHALVAAEQLNAEGAGVEFVFLGGGTALEGLQTAVRDRGISNVRFVARVPMAEVGRMLATADALLVQLRDDPLFAITVPSKTQAYLYAGKPVIMAVRGNAAELIETAQAGVVATPGDPASLAHAIRRLMAMSAEERNAMGARGRKFYDDHLSLRRGTEKTIAVLQEALRASRA